MRHAHKVLLEGHQNPNWKAETVTLLGCMAMKLSSLEINSGLNNRSWFVLCCCIGNSKVFRWNVGKKSIREITKASVVLDETTNEPSGRLGAFSGDKPDLNNFSLYSKICNEGDILLILSPSVYMNCDPIVLGKKPSDLGFIESDWNSVPNVQKVRSEFQCRKMMELFFPDQTSVEENQNNCVNLFTKSLLNHCTSVTDKTRSYMENSLAEEPLDFVEYPGKMGHATCLSISLDTSNLVVGGGSDELVLSSIKKQVDMQTIFKSMAKGKKIRGNVIYEQGNQ
eukprot:TRINITY_DN4238_c0_g6_i4.p1 TRINITY_DN4238_c0_g6~~TRINITY_DN4238_c0_g6_i4.p1  ORF type:complete len:282 (-),score=51.15 TRINITY_DN4238_c0_g6_i4:78-923(-)